MKNKHYNKVEKTKNNKMVIRFIKIFALICIISITIIRCKKEKENEDNNPTNGKTTAHFNANITYGTMTDQDGNIYKTITIDTITWMAENLRVITYNDGTPISNVTDDNSWKSLTTGAYCNYRNTNNIVNIATYGRLYNWYAINTGKLAPKGWHVAHYWEWLTLFMKLGGTNQTGNKFKEIGTEHWTSYNKGATNELGFTALPSGYRNTDGQFSGFSENTSWWTDPPENLIWTISLFSSDNSVTISGYIANKALGISVRCVKD